jgi:hypothetical protein
MSNILVNEARKQRTAASTGFKIERLSALLLLFSILSVVFFILLVFLRIPLPINPSVSFQDAFDVLTPLVLIPLYWILFRFAASESPTLVEELVFIGFAAFWIEGQGMHLSANSVSNLMEALSKSGLIDLNGNSLFSLVHFYDENLGHYLWHVGVLGLAGLLIFREWRGSAWLQTAWSLVIPAGLIYGFFLFIITVEGNTVWLGLPFSILVVLFGLLNGRGELGRRPVLAFFLVSCVIATLLYTGWGLYWRGYPGFFETGMIK